MSDITLVDTVKAAQKTAMKARDKERTAVLRLMLSEFKRIEVDERVDLDDARALAILDKMIKQRRDSLQQYESAGREDLASREKAEIDVIQEFLPGQLGEEEIDTLIDEAIAGADGSGMAVMGAVMGQLKPQLQGRADMGAVSQRVKAKLQG